MDSINTTGSNLPKEEPGKVLDKVRKEGEAYRAKARNKVSGFYKAQLKHHARQSRVF